jgi:hypothetical protein
MLDTPTPSTSPTPPTPPTSIRRPLRERIASARTAPQLTSVADWLRRNRWMGTPIAIALGVRLTLFLLVDICARLINGPTFAGRIATWDRYDSAYYVEIAQQGYYSVNHQGVILANFFPLFPLAIWLVQHVTLLFEHKYSYLLAGLIVSTSAFVAVCVVLYRLALDRFGAATAYGAVLLLATFPFALYYGVSYTESLYLLCVLLAFLGIERRQWWLAALGALLAGATRPPGLIVAFCVILAYALDWLRTRGPLRRDALWLALAPMGTFGFFAMCYVVYGNPLEYLVASGPGNWNGGHLQLTGLQEALPYLLNPGELVRTIEYNRILYSVYLLLTMVFLLSLVPVIRRLGLPYALFAAFSIIAPIIDYPHISSLGRYLSIIFPTFLVAAHALRNRPVLREALVLAGAVSLGVFTLMFALNFPVY